MRGLLAEAKLKNPVFSAEEALQGLKAEVASCAAVNQSFASLQALPLCVSLLTMTTNSLAAASLLELYPSICYILFVVSISGYFVYIVVLNVQTVRTFQKLERVGFDKKDCKNEGVEDQEQKLIGSNLEDSSSIQVSLIELVSTYGHSLQLKVAHLAVLDYSFLGSYALFLCGYVLILVQTRRF